jgi:ABC-type nitrate/sulfonate/bicarbonate transport system ATPase subunit
MIIEMRNLSKIFVSKEGNTEALRNINLRVEENEFLTIVGPSGCGKSTLLYLIAGLEKPTSGEIRFIGEKKATGPLTSLVWQEYALFPWRTVKGNIEFGPEVRGVPKDRRESIVKRYIKMVGLEGFEHKYPHQLSGGMKQKVALCRAYANDPEILLMDEPFAALDAQTRILMQLELQRIWLEEKKTVVYVTHSIDEAVFLGDRIVVLTRRPGEIKKIKELSFERPRSSDVKKSATFLDICEEIWSLLKEEAERAITEV